MKQIEGSSNLKVLFTSIFSSLLDEIVVLIFMLCLKIPKAFKTDNMFSKYQVDYNARLIGYFRYQFWPFELLFRNYIRNKFLDSNAECFFHIKDPERLQMYWIMNYINNYHDFESVYRSLSLRSSQKIWVLSPLFNSHQVW